jgi:hypothetical protein
MKETLEEAAERLYPKIITDPYNPSEDLLKEERNIFIEGAKYQADNMYSEEEVRKMLFDLGDVLFNNSQNGIEEGEPEKYFDVIIEQFKKK